MAKSEYPINWPRGRKLGRQSVGRWAPEFISSRRYADICHIFGARLVTVGPNGHITRDVSTDPSYIPLLLVDSSHGSYCTDGERWWGSGPAYSGRIYYKLCEPELMPAKELLANLLKECSIRM